MSKFSKGTSDASLGRRKVLDLGTDDALTLSEKHSNNIILCGGATCAVTLPNANTLPVGWNVKLVVNDETAVTTITGVADQMIGHVVTGHDNQNRQLQPPSAINFDVITFTAGGLKGDWVELVCISSGLFWVNGDSRTTDKITCTSP